MDNFTTYGLGRLNAVNEALVQQGHYSAAYFLKLRDILHHDQHDPIVKMQVFQRGHGTLAGVNKVVGMLLDADSSLEIEALPDGSDISPHESVMMIKGRLQSFAHLESVYLGLLARMTRVATNVRKVVDAANCKQVYYLADRFDIFTTQHFDGKAALIGGASGVCTEAMTPPSGEMQAMGTMPHALIAAYGGDTVLAAKKYAEYYPDEPVTALVDFHNTCVTTSLEVARALGDRLGAVRLDTSGNMVDESVIATLEERFGSPLLPEVHAANTGVCPTLVSNVRGALDREGFSHVKIIVSGGFTPERIATCEKLGLAIDAYGVGSSLIKSGEDFTADIVEVDGSPCAKVGRQLNPNPRLVRMT